MSFTATLCQSQVTVTKWLNRLQAPLALGLRLYLAKLFFESGLVKIQSWDSTVALFSDEFHVPLLAPLPAAVLATGIELVLPVLLVLGLGTRVAAAALFVFNAVAVIAYPDISEAGVMQHQFWGVLLFLLVAYGPGRWSLDSRLEMRSSSR
jgi:putative oxidoreductase